jgi:hypothetical protein
LGAATPAAKPFADLRECQCRKAVGSLEAPLFCGETVAIEAAPYCETHMAQANVRADKTQRRRSA